MTVTVTPDGDSDYVTVLDTRYPEKKIACVMHYNKTADEYVQTRCSQAISKTAAEGLAKVWASTLKLEIR